MKVVIFGLTISSSWGNGHATIWRGLCRQLTARGHDVVFFERDVPYYAAHRDVTSLQDGELVLYDNWEQVQSLACRHCDEADAAIVTSYCPDGRIAAEIVLSSLAQRRLFYDLDTPVTLSRLETEQGVPYLPRNGLRDFDLVLSFTGGRALTELRRRLGARAVAPLYGGVDPQVHCRTSQRPAYACDLSYLGTYADDRQSMLQELFVEPALRHSDRRFLIGGAQYPQSFPWSGNIYFVYHLPPNEHPSFFSSSRATLNVTRSTMASMGYCPSGRLFEAAACGCPILTDGWEGLESFFVPGREVLLCRSAADVTDALDRSDGELVGIARAAHERTLAEYTAAHRALELERLIENAATFPAAALSVEA